ncbi:MAG: FG-GAP repeat protein, partial [Planctomycetes bacterium]|nr:FG-GAP repeat protein [Planctomycetota bacterium]
MEALNKNTALLALVGGTLLAGARPTYAQCEQAKLAAPNPAVEDRFGWGVSMSGERAIVAVPWDDDGCVEDPDCGTGAAYVYRREGTAWVEEAKLTAPDAIPGHLLSHPLGFAGDVAVLGARFDNDVASNAGAAYVFRRSDTSWTLEAKLTASDGEVRDYYGTPGVSGNLTVVGASGKRCEDGSIVCGAAYVYRYNGVAWVEEAKLLGSDTSSRDAFGISVAIDGDRIVVGAWLDDDACPTDILCNSGSAYVFRYDGAAWVQEAKLVASDAEFENRFGFSISISGEDLIVGSSQNDDACPEDPNCNSGSAYVFRWDGADWTEEAKLTAGDAAQGDFFGSSVVLRGNVALVGASGDDVGGSAYLFQRNGTNWIEMGKLTASDVSGGFGASVSFDEDYAIVGAPSSDVGGTGTGAAYVYRIFGEPDTNSNGINDSCEGDCNGNGIPDEDDIANETSDDCNANGIPDECEPDCNANGVADSCDISEGTSQDCTGNFVPDECEPDCNTNGAADSCDIDDGTSQDCTGNHVPDECEPDCNENGVADSCDIATGTSRDCNGNAVPDACDIAVGTSQDCTGDGVPDDCDPDCNFSGTPDSCDILEGISQDIDEDGIPDECENWSLCQTGPEYFDFGPHRLDSEAERLAMQVSWELRAPDDEYDRIRSDLSLIREAFPMLDAVVDDPGYAPDQLIVRLSSSGSLPSYEDMNTYYQVVEDSLLGGTDTHLLTFCDNLNAPVLSAEYTALPGVLYAEPNLAIGTDDEITITLLGGVRRYTIVDGFHDCFDGCDCERTWVIDVDEAGDVTLILYDENDFGWSWCVFEETACCLPSGTCGAMTVQPCLNQNGAPLAFEAVCQGDPDQDGLDGVCGDNCPDDPNKVDPGDCGCG